MILNTSAKHVFEILYGKNSKDFWHKLHEKTGGSCRVESEWIQGPVPTREVNFTLAMKYILSN